MRLRFLQRRKYDHTAVAELISRLRLTDKLKNQNVNQNPRNANHSNRILVCTYRA